MHIIEDKFEKRTKRREVKWLKVIGVSSWCWEDALFFSISINEKSL